MTNQELFEQAVAGNWIAESFEPREASDGVGKFYLSGSSKGYSNFSDSIDDGQVVFYAAFDDDCNREAGYGIFNSTDMSITPVETTATLRNDKYIDGDVAPVPFPNGGTITGTFNAVAFNAIWAHIWDKNNPHEVNAEQVEQDNENQLGDNVQDALDNLSGIIAEWDNAIKSTSQNYVQEIPPPNPQKGDMWTDVGVSGEQYVWEGDYWVSVTGGGLGVDLDDLETYPSQITTDVLEDDQLYDIPLERVISSTTGKGEWVAGGDGSGNVFVPEAPDDGLQYGRQSGTWTEIDAGGVWDADGIDGPDGGGIGHYYHLSNAPNTNIFETAIGSDEVKMLNMTSVASDSFTDLDGSPILTGYSTETYVDEAIAAIPPTDLSGVLKKQSHATQYMSGQYNLLEWGTVVPEGEERGAYSAITLGQGSGTDAGLGGSALYIETDNGSYSINNFSFYVRGGKIQGAYGATIVGFDSVQATDFLDADGNSIVGGGGGGGGGIQGGETEGQVTTWDGANWTPNDNVTIDEAGNATFSNLLSAKDDAGDNAFRAGPDCAVQTQGESATAVGHQAAQYRQGAWATAIGFKAGNADQGPYSTAVGRGAGQSTQGEAAVAIGFAAGTNQQKNHAVAIGDQAGSFYQGQYAIAIGKEAGKSNQAQNSICINSTGSNVNVTSAGEIVIKSTTHELISTPIGFAMNGEPVIGARKLISTLSTLRNATQDETTLEGLRDAIGNAIGGLIEEFEAEIATMPAGDEV